MGSFPTYSEGEVTEGARLEVFLPHERSGGNRDYRSREAQECGCRSQKTEGSPVDAPKVIGLHLLDPSCVIGN